MELLDKTNHEINYEVAQMQKTSVNWLCKENGQFTSRQPERKLDFFKTQLGLGHFIENIS